MLRIERLDVNGFKSFSERTTVEFTPGITAVVGPNGCGKSNIADALQWVLGEQSARALRGRRMEDVIFAGSEQRGPGGMAEVTLHLVGRNEEALPNGAERLLLTRRLFRTGESDYLIDGKQSRLSDIRALLDKIRAGRRTYGVIDQAHVASFVVSKPRERRLFIEEAAGIAGFKQRRRLSENKMEATRANLLRVDDILREVERQMRSLKRQASLARRARRLDEQLRALRTVWYRRRDRDLGVRVEEMTETHAVAEREAAHLERERGRVATLLASAREELEKGHADRERAVERSHEERLDEQRLRREIDTSRARAEALEQEAEHHEGEGRRLEADRARRREEIAALEQQLERLVTDLGDVEERLRSAESQLDDRRQTHSTFEDEATQLERSWFDKLHERADATAQLSAAREAAARDRQRAEEASEARDRLEASKSRAEVAFSEAREQLLTAERREQETTERLAEARREEEDSSRRLDEVRGQEAMVARQLGSVAGEKAALDSLEVRLAGADSAREVLEQADRRGLAARGVFGDALTVDKEIELAAEAFLADLLPSIVVDTADDVLRGAQLAGGGTVRFLPLDAPALGQSEGDGELPRRLAGDPRVRGRLRGRLRCSGASSGLDGSLIARVEDAVVVDELATGLELHRAFPNRSFLTLAGDVVASSGFVTIAARGDGGTDGMLSRSRRRQELTLVLSDLGVKNVEASTSLARAREAARAAETRRRAADEELRERHREATAQRMRVEQAEREVERLERESALAATVREQAESALGEIDLRATQLVAVVDTAEAVIAGARGALDVARENLRTHEEDVRQAAAIVGGLASDRRAFEERRVAVQRDVDRLQQELAELRAQTERGGEARQSARVEAAALRRRADEQERTLTLNLSRREEVEEEASGWGGRLASLTATVREAETRLDRVGEEFEGARARRESAMLEAERSRLALTHEREACREELGCEASSLPDVRPEGFEDEILDTDAMLKAEILQHKKKRERVGLVNPLAEQEYEELSVRYQELSTQREDLGQSIEELKEAIRRMNRESRERFQEAFNSIRRHYKEQFAVLFRGGRADLLLEDEDDPLESGIEIMCQPPGKKLQSVSLLSGGEKALAATAVLFAIFKFQPPPFCLLDEVDAPLDDANVGRFADCLKKFTEETQFILITHNKRSMEMADMLYGVTMPEPGVSHLVSMTLD
ncbi:MAG: chromosome segregation protein SMC [Acidobacteriota bacterium]|nr:chromosome segregation protein SMC [Acidobacteriota bacterium]